MFRFIVALLLVGVIAYYIGFYIGFRRGARNKSNIEIDITPAPDGQKPPEDVNG